jgi:signal peptidase I
MSGVYDINDVIAVKDCDTNTLKVGDDIAYQGSRGGLEGLLITHRIIRIEEKEDGGRIFVTKGVNAPGEDPAIEESQILGKVVGIVPVISFINHIVKTQLGFFFLIFCPLVIIIVLEVLQTITDYQLDKNEIKEIEDKSIFKKDAEEK